MPREVYALRWGGYRDSVSVPVRKKQIVYPDSDGKPMADNTKQFNWIVKIKEGLEVLFADRADVFVAGDLLWYPYEGDNKTRIAPDAMVVFGRPKGHRGSYRQWEEDGVAPHTVFEVLSPGNTKKEMEEKREKYDQYGVEEYYEYDPDRISLKGWVRSGSCLESVANMQGWVSPGLGIRFELTDSDLLIFRPDGQRFLDFLETEKRKKQAEELTEKERLRAEKERLRAEKERKQAEKERKQAEKERLRAEKEKKQAEKERLRAEKAEEEKKRAESVAEAERQRAEKLAARLRELGLSADV